MGTTKRIVAAAAIGIISLGALALQVGTSSAGGVVARAEMRNQDDVVIGTVTFKKKGNDIVGIADVQLPVAVTEFRGFHIHADDVGSTGNGCVVGADPAVITDDFLSADGHWKTASSQQHGAHAGDLPVLMRDAGGHAKSTFVIGKFLPGDIIGKPVIIHAVADNYANIPTRYQSSATSTPPGPDATTLGNGDAGARYACGVIVSTDDDSGEDDD